VCVFQTRLVAPLVLPWWIFTLWPARICLHKDNINQNLNVPVYVLKINRGVLTNISTETVVGRAAVTCKRHLVAKCYTVTQLLIYHTERSEAAKIACTSARDYSTHWECQK